MHFPQISLFGLVGVGAVHAAAVLDKRTAAQVESDIATVAADLTSFANAIESFNGSLLQALSLLSAYNTLSSAVEAATAEVTSTGTLASADSATIYAAVDSLTAQITTTLGDVTDKYSVVESSGYTSAVCSALSTLYTDSDAFFDALESTIDSAYTGEVETLQATADAGFESTISTYGC